MPGGQGEARIGQSPLEEGGEDRIDLAGHTRQQRDALRLYHPGKRSRYAAAEQRLDSQAHEPPGSQERGQPPQRLPAPRLLARAAAVHDGEFLSPVEHGRDAPPETRHGYPHVTPLQLREDSASDACGTRARDVWFTG